MNTKAFFIFLLLLGFHCGFSQAFSQARCDGPFVVEPSPFGNVKPLELPITSLEMLGKIEVCASPFNQNYTFAYQPIVYDWAAAAQRIQDYKNFQYRGHPQDVNGRDLVLDVITNEMLNGILHHKFPN